MVALVLCYSFTSQYINPSFLHSRQMVMKLLILHRLPDRFYCISQVLIYISQANARPKRDRQMSTLVVESCSSNLDLNDHHGIHESSDDNDNTYIPEPDEPEESGTEEKKNDEEKGVATDPPPKKDDEEQGKNHVNRWGVLSMARWP
jgi:hypothetical protein